MHILVIGAQGFIGRNLCEALKAVRDGKDRSRVNQSGVPLHIAEVMEADIDTPAVDLGEYCSRADFVFYLAGVNRPQDASEFMEGNHNAVVRAMELLEGHGNACPVMFASSIHAAKSMDAAGDTYEDSKAAGEEAVFRHARSMNSQALVYRFPNVFGKWCRPNYNSAVATFCHNIANDLPITVKDPRIELELLYIDDLVDEMMFALQGRDLRCDWVGTACIPAEDGLFRYVPVTHRATLGEIVQLLDDFAMQPRTLQMPYIPQGSFAKKLYSTYLSYLPQEKVSFPLQMNCDERGSFTELLRTDGCGQFSVNVSKPGVTKGQHWHHTKWEFFMVVSGEALIRMRRIGSEEVFELRVSGEELRAVHMLPGYTHSIANLSDSQDLVTLMWANEPFDPARPDTFFEEV